MARHRETRGLIETAPCFELDYDFTLTLQKPEGFIAKAPRVKP